jgi:hypothetical protein
MKSIRAANAPARATAIGDETGSNAATKWFMAVLFLLAAAGVLWWFRGSLNYDFNSPNFNPLGLIPVAFAAIGLWNLVPAIRGALVARKFAGTTFEMDGGDSVMLGETLKGRIRTATDLAPTSDYVVTIQCVEAITHTSQSDLKQTTEDHTRWEATRNVAAASVRSSHGIPVEFRLPTTALARGDERAKGSVRWILEARASLPGTDFSAIFPVDVRPTRG